MQYEWHLNEKRKALIYSEALTGVLGISRFNGRILFQCVLNNHRAKMWIKFNCLRYNTAVSFLNAVLNIRFSLSNDNYFSN